MMTDENDKTINTPDDELKSTDTSDETEDDAVEIDWLGENEEDE